LEEEKSSSFADEGTLAHAIGAAKLKSWLKQDTSEEEREIAQYAKYHTSEMEDYTDTYVSIVLEKYTAALKKTKDAKLLIETRLDFTEFIPESFGTGDAVIIADGEAKTGTASDAKISVAELKKLDPSGDLDVIFRKLTKGEAK
jgi:hypothetical protein